MQMSASECTDLSRETEQTQRLYGLDEKVTSHFGKNCLLARRLVERGVRFVQVYSGGNEGPKAWDAHDDLKKNHDLHCAETDRPIAALLQDLAARGLLDTTLVVWGGEFGRSPVAENGKGRDHHPKGFTMWMAGGGIKGGITHGATDDFGYEAIEDPVSVPDLHATILHQLGMDHKRLTYRFSGRDYRLTDVSGNVLHELLT
jgi:arylsulfatase A-like enzyme